MKTPKFEIIAGTYEEFLLGFHFISKVCYLLLLPLYSEI